MIEEEKKQNWFSQHTSNLMFELQKKLPNFIKIFIYRNQQTPKFSSILVLGGLIFTIFCFFQIKTLISLSILFIGIYLKLNLNLEKLRMKGLISYLPKSAQIILTSRSIFDILCDFWYIVRIPSYVKVFFRPFFLEIEPEQAITNLNELHPSIKQVILRKGIINNFPEWMKKIVLPIQKQLSKQNILQELEDTYDEEIKSQELESNQNNEQEQQQQQQEFILDQNSAKDIWSSGENKRRISNESDSESGNEFQQFSIQRGGSCGNIYQILEKHQRKAISEDQSQIDCSDQDLNQQHLQLNTSQLVGGLQMKTRVICSSGSSNHNHQLLSKYFNTKFMQLRGWDDAFDIQFSQKWDKLELFQNENKKEQQRFSENKLKIKGPISLIYSLLEIKRMGLSNAIGSKDLRLIFALSSLGFLWQLYISKRVRGWTANVFVIIFYIIFFVLSTSSWVLLVYKMIKQRSVTSSEPEMLKEDNQIEEATDEDDGQEEIDKLNNEDNENPLN